jgi:hypothetical protein
VPQSSCGSGRLARATRAIAGLHADSWQRHYRGAFSDAFLDHDVAGYLLPLWTERLAIPNPRACTILAQHDGAVVGLSFPPDRGGIGYKE